MPRYEFVEGTSSKFWEITLNGSAFTVRYGRIGTDGQVQEKSWPTDAKAKAEHDKLVKEKTGKGYTLVGSAPAATEEAAVAAPATDPESAPAAATKPAKAPKKAAPPPEPPPAAPPPGQDGFLDAGGGYGLGLRDGAIVARNDKGKVLASVPKSLKDTEIYDMLEGAVEFLEQHAVECREQVEGWMLRSLPVPRKVLEAVWVDPDWKRPLENLVVKGTTDAGILRAVGEKGLGVVTLDGETVWLADGEVSLPHPILLEELDDWRAILTELGVEQGSAQLFRETFRKPVGDDAKKPGIDQFSGGEFDLLATVNNVAKKLGYRVSGGCAICRVLENGVSTEGRYYIGEGDPMSETSTGDLVWVDGKQQLLTLEQVPPVAFSEGMRMASAIWSKRKIEKKEDADA
jgi:predicted DNA-binding WGR domain protein